MDKPAWLKVSISVNGELAEAVAEVFSRTIPSGVVIENTNFGRDKNPNSDELIVIGFLPMDAHIESARQKLEESIWHLGRIQPLPKLSYENIQEMNWMEAWKEHFHPLPVGENLLIIPAWVDPSEYAGMHIITIDPGMAFGTGSHPTTQLSLELLEKWIVPGQDVIDIGCGTGILSIAAAKLGARRILAVDVDRVAVDYAKVCLEYNQVTKDIELGLGSVNNILAGEYHLLKANLVIANILAKILLKLFADDIDELISEDGVLILSGILVDQEEGILKAIKFAGLEIVDKRVRGDWIALVCQKKTQINPRPDPQLLVPYYLKQ